MGLESCFRDLTAKERLYVESRLKGLGKTASAAAAGYAQPHNQAQQIERRTKVKEALEAAIRMSAEEVGFTRREAHDLLMQSYMSASTAAEQVAAVREMIKLHGIAKPQQVEHKHTHEHSGELTFMSDEQLLQLADMDDLVIEGEYEEVGDTELLEDLTTDGQEVDDETVLQDLPGGD